MYCCKLETQTEHTEYLATFHYHNQTNGWIGILQLLWRYNADQCRSYTSCRYRSLDYDEVTPVRDWTPWHGRFEVSDLCGRRVVCAYFDYEGSDECTREKKWSSFMESAEAPWSYTGTDYMRREVGMRWSREIQFYADELGHPELTAGWAKPRNIGCGP